MEGGRLVRGALLLALAGGISRFLGIFYLIPLPRLIGEEGMGLWQMAGAWQGLLVVLASGGLPLAMARLVAEARATGEAEREWRLLRLGLGLATLTGLAGALALFWVSPMLAWRLQRDRALVMVLRAFAPSVLLLAQSSVLRGYFQGCQAMGVAAASEVAEQVFRVGSLLALAAALAARGPGEGAAGAALGASIGGGAAVLLMAGALWWRRRQVTPLSRPYGGSGRRRPMPTLRDLGHDVPAGVALSLVYALIQTAVAAVIPYRLRLAGVPVEQVRELYGQFGLAFRLVGVPGFISLALGATLLPAVAQARTLGRLSMVARRSEQAIRLLLLIAIPAATGLAVLAEPLARLIFAMPGVALPLRAAAAGVVGIMLFQTTTGILQGLDLIFRPALNLATAGLLQVALSWWWVGETAGGGRAMVGAGAAAAVAWLVAAILNLLMIVRRTGITISFNEMFVRPLLASGGMAVVVATVHQWLLGLPGRERLWAPLAALVGRQVGQELIWPAIACLGAIGAGVVSYGLLLAALGGLGWQERRWLLRLWRRGFRAGRDLPSGRAATATRMGTSRSRVWQSVAVWQGGDGDGRGRGRDGKAGGDHGPAQR
ncbi:MAG: polysaccharide biosynthesis protein [Limnochordales bacterium]|nr:polysaccharide biosynthesis protein [Limnochordales bacterium]